LEFSFQTIDTVVRVAGLKMRERLEGVANFLIVFDLRLQLHKKLLDDSQRRRSWVMVMFDVLDFVPADNVALG
jgi:hypothetical protein